MLEFAKKVISCTLIASIVMTPMAHAMDDLHPHRIAPKKTPLGPVNRNKEASLELFVEDEKLHCKVPGKDPIIIPVGDNPTQVTQKGLPPKIYNTIIGSFKNPSESTETTSLGLKRDKPSFAERYKQALNVVGECECLAVFDFLALCGYVTKPSLWRDVSHVSTMKNYGEWQYVKHMPGHGGGDGVHLFLDPKTDRKIVVKSAKNHNHFIEEIIGRKTYEVFGHLVPQSQVLERISCLWPEAWNEKFPDVPRVQISEFIEGGAGDENDKSKLSRWFDILVGNFDLAAHNYIINHSGTPVPVDFGCFARFRANGDRKVFEDLWSYRFISPPDMVAPTMQELIDFKAYLPTYFQTLIDMHHQFNIPDFPSLWNILTSRIQSFLVQYDPNPPVFNAERPAVEGKMAAGVLPIANIKGIPHAFLGKRHQDGHWSDLGGLAVPSDHTLSRTAWRECHEELAVFKYYDYTAIAQSPFIDHHGQDTLYRMYLLAVDPFDTTDLNQHIDSQKIYNREHSDFQWVPIENLFSLDAIHAPMKASLSTNHAQKMIRNFAAGHTVRRVKSANPFMGQKAIGDYVYPVLNVDFLDSQGFFARATAVRLIHNKFKITTLPLQLNVPLTASEAFLRVHLKDQYVEGDEKENLRALLSKKSDYYKSRGKELEASLPFIQTIIGKETHYPNHLGFVHGSEGHFGLLWLIGHVMRSTLSLQDVDSVRTLRLFEKAFEGVDTLDEHFQALDTNTQDHGTTDYKLGGQARILSTNASILLSLGRDSSESLSLFLRGDSVHPIDKPREILVKFLEALKLPELAVNLFLSEMDLIFKSLEKCGALWQLFLPSGLAHRYVYLSHPGGSPVIFKGQNKDAVKRNSPVEYLTRVRTNPKDILEILEDENDFNLTQCRVLLHPEMLYGRDAHQVHTHVYFSDQRDPGELLTIIAKSVDRYLRPHLYLANVSGAFSTPPKLIQLHNSITGTLKHEIPAKLMELMEVSKRDGAVSPSVLTMVQDPEVAKLESIDPLSLKRVRALELCAYTLSLANRLYERLPTMAAQTWANLMTHLSKKHAELISYLEAEKLTDSQRSNEDISKLLTIGDLDSPDFPEVKSLISIPNVRKILENMGGIRRQFHLGDTHDSGAGAILAIIHSWGMMNHTVLYCLWDSDILLQGQFPHDTNNLTEILALKEMDPNRIVRVVTSLQKMTELKPTSIVKIGAMSHMCIECGFVEHVGKGKIRDIKRTLRPIFTKLGVSQTNPINYSTAKGLLDLVESMGDRFDPTLNEFNRVLKGYTHSMDWTRAITFVDEEPRTEQFVQTLEVMGVIQAGTQYSGLPDLLSGLAHEASVVTYLKHLYSAKIGTSLHVLSHLAWTIHQLPENDRVPMCQVVKGVLDKCRDDQEVQNAGMSLPMILQEHSGRLQDLQMLLSLMGSFNHNSKTLIDWALKLPPDQFAQVPWLLKLGCDTNGAYHISHFDTVLENLDFVMAHSDLLAEVLKLSGWSANVIFDCLKSKKLTRGILEILSKLPESSINYLRGAHTNDVLSRIAHTPIPFQDLFQFYESHCDTARYRCFEHPEFYDLLDTLGANLVEGTRGKPSLSNDETLAVYHDMMKLYASNYFYGDKDIFDLAVAIVRYDLPLFHQLVSNLLDQSNNVGQNFRGYMSTLVKGLPGNLCVIRFFLSKKFNHHLNVHALVTIENPELVIELLEDQEESAYYQPPVRGLEAIAKAINAVQDPVKREKIKATVKKHIKEIFPSYTPYGQTRPHTYFQENPYQYSEFLRLTGSPCTSGYNTYGEFLILCDRAKQVNWTVDAPKSGDSEFPWQDIMERMSRSNQQTSQQETHIMNDFRNFILLVEALQPYVPTVWKFKTTPVDFYLELWRFHTLGLIKETLGSTGLWGIRQFITSITSNQDPVDPDALMMALKNIITSVTPQDKENVVNMKNVTLEIRNEYLRTLKSGS